MNKIWHCGRYNFDTSVPQIMGIVNVTPDSFSDGGSYATCDRAVEHAYELIKQGATIIDIGGESTRSGSVAPSAQEEIDRVVPVIEKLAGSGVALSVDTRHAAVARAAVEAGADIINDIAGFRDPDMIAVAAASDAGLVVMHMQGSPESMQKNPHYDDVAREVRTYLRSRAQELTRHGIEHQRIALDPGFGFGKTYAHNLTLLAHVNRIVDLGYPVLVGVSRKSFIGQFTGIEVPADRDEASAQLAADFVARNCMIVRVHNVEQTARALADVEQAKHRAFIALGSNQGEKLSNVKNALGYIARIPHTKITACSHAYASEPAYKTDQDTFVNGVVEVETALAPLAFFAELQAIEAVMLRKKTIENGPRNIDVDLLMFDEQCINLPALVVPHPRIEERDFVVTPLLEIAPTLVIPGAGLLTRSHIKYGRVTEQLEELCPHLSQSGKAGKKQAAGKVKTEKKRKTPQLSVLQERLHLTKTTVTIGIIIALVFLGISSATLWWVTTPNYAVERAINAAEPGKSWIARQALRWSLFQSNTTNDGEEAVVTYASDGEESKVFKLVRQPDGGWKIRDER